MMYWIICYDIRDNKRRTKIVKVMESYGIRAQYSVFECDISDRQQMTMQGELEKIIDKEEDDIRFYPLNGADINRVKTLGDKTRLHFDTDIEII